MARTDTLTNYLTDIADAIREKTGSSDPIQASSFDTAIENIPSGGGYPPDWSEIGYSGTPDYITNAFDYAKDIYDNWDSSITSMSYLYNGNQTLNFMPLVDTSNVTSMYYTFYECARLVYVPLLNTSNVTDMEGMFSSCGSLKSIPSFDTSKVTNMRNMFSSCQNIITVQQLNTEKVSDMSGLFSGCQRLVNIPQLNTANVKNASSMFGTCKALISIPLLDMGKAIAISSMFSVCSALESLGGLKDLGKAYQTSRQENYSSYTLDFSSCPLLTHESLMNVINNLYDIKTKGCRNQKLNLGSTNLAKLTAEEIAIATNKGWNVT